MKIPYIFLFAAALAAEEAPKPAVPAVAAATNDKSIMIVDPKMRANDYVQAFDLLKKDKPTLKMIVRTSGAILQNVTELTAAPGGTLLYARLFSNQGAKIQIIPIEEMREISYSP